MNRTEVRSQVRVHSEDTHMPKLKTHRGAAKRFKDGQRKVSGSKAFKQHILTSKSASGNATCGTAVVQVRLEEAGADAAVHKIVLCPFAPSTTDQRQNKGPRTFQEQQMLRVKRGTVRRAKRKSFCARRVITPTRASRSAAKESVDTALARLRRTTAQEARFQAVVDSAHQRRRASTGSPTPS